MLVPVLFGVSVLVFSMIRLIPGDIVDSMLGQEAASPAVYAQMRATFGLDRPMYVQYIQWIGGVLRGDFGVSLRSGQPIVGSILSALPVTAELALVTLVLSCSIAIPLGVISGLKRNSWTDLVVRTTGLLGISLPNFWLATLFILIASVGFGWLPALIFVSPFQDLRVNLSQIIMPSVVLATGLSAITMRQTRSAVLDVVRRDYVRTAQAKGLREQTVIVRHVLKNALIPVITVVGLQVGFLLSGTVIIEQILGIPGMGWLLLNAINRRDYPVVQAVTLLLAVFFVTANLIVDILYAVVDPRIRYVK